MSCLRKSSVLFATVHLGLIPSSQTSGGTPKPTQLQGCTLQNNNKDQPPPIALADFGRTSFTIFTTMFHRVSICRKTYWLAMLYPFISIYIHLDPFISIYIHSYPFISIYIIIYYIYIIISISIFIYIYIPAAPSIFPMARSIGVDVSQLSYWWRLAGGSPYRVAAERLVLRPTPPILRAPRDGAGGRNPGVAMGIPPQEIWVNFITSSLRANPGNHS